jgi:hypothetical protein
MKPIFADFVRIIYGGEDYIDYEDVKNKENVKGMINDLYFIKHNKEETEDIGLKSKQNIYEAKYITKLCNYLILQNYKPENITILTFYIGQVFLIRKYLKENDIKNVRVTSVDNYQGEENDIILLSLVRSNKNSEIGFLSSFNRVCVAFSRAKIGMYIIGNIDCIVESESKYKKNNIKSDEKMLGVWSKIKQKAEEMKIIGEKITLICQNHRRLQLYQKLKILIIVLKEAVKNLVKQEGNVDMPAKNYVIIMIAILKNVLNLALRNMIHVIINVLNYVMKIATNVKK